MGIFSTWQFNLVGFLIFIVAFFNFYKLAVRNAKVDGAATILLQLIGGLSVLLFSPLFPFIFPSDWRVYLLLFFAGIFYALNDRLQTTVRKNLEVSFFSIISQCQTIFLIGIGVLIFKEPLVLTKISGLLFILAGNLTVLYKKGTFEFNKNTLLGILAALTFSIAISIDIGISQQFNLPIYIMLTLIPPAFMIMVTERIKLAAVVHEFKSANQKYYLITGLIWGLTIIFALRSYQFGSVTTIVPLQAVSVLMNIIVAHYFLHENKDIFKKVMASLLVILGVFLTVV